MHRNYRLVVLGAGGVGKTSLVDRFVNDNFSDAYNPTVEDIHRHLVQLPDGAFQGIEILDTAGLHQFPAMRTLSIKSGNAFVLVYAIDDKDSFQDALQLADLIKTIKGLDNVPMVFVGNKLDCSQERAVSEPDAYEAALKRSAAYVETSAKYRTNVQDVFMALIIKTLIPAKPKSMQKHHKRRLSRVTDIKLRRSSNDVSETSEEYPELIKRDSNSSDTSCSIPDQSGSGRSTPSEYDRLSRRGSAGLALMSGSPRRCEKYRRSYSSCSFRSQSPQLQFSNDKYRRSSSPCFLESCSSPTPSEYDNYDRYSTQHSSDSCFTPAEHDFYDRNSCSTPSGPRCPLIRVTSPQNEKYRRSHTSCSVRTCSSPNPPPFETYERSKSSCSALPNPDWEAYRRSKTRSSGVIKTFDRSGSSCSTRSCSSPIPPEFEKNTSSGPHLAVGPSSLSCRSCTPNPFVHEKLERFARRPNRSKSLSAVQLSAFNSSEQEKCTVM